MKTVDFSETIAASDLKVGRSRHLSEYMKVQYNPDRTCWSGSTELMRVIGEARIKYPIFSGPTNFYVYGSIRYCLLYAIVLLIFDPIKCVKYLEAIN